MKKLNLKNNISPELLADIQEITLRASELGIFATLFNKEDIARDEILALFAKWGVEFRERYASTGLLTNFYYDMVDEFLKEKMTFRKPVVEHRNSLSHDLVDAVNEAWKERGSEFFSVLTMLYERDIKKVVELPGFSIDDAVPGTVSESVLESLKKGYDHAQETGDWSRYEEAVLQEMRENWYDCAGFYLNGVADDHDLLTILNYLKINLVV